VEREPAALSKPFSLLRGTNGSNPFLSSGESIKPETLGETSEQDGPRPMYNE
jgi:hypothetical protein